MREAGCILREYLEQRRLADQIYNNEIDTHLLQQKKDQRHGQQASLSVIYVVV
ncbi:hypothetical protein SAMN04515695_0663 [Pseudovibrio sp. Tun.PSC04-5.I4]|nr:hypothetical protein SAMN04515695_0663 [Pseudovibrio sp. Tun.PSC04-5.I4]